MSQRRMPFSQNHQMKGTSQTSAIGGQKAGRMINTATATAHAANCARAIPIRFSTSPTIHRGVKRDG